MNDQSRIIKEAFELFESEQYEKGLYLILPLVEQGNAKALGMLGLAYQVGLGVELDGPLAVKYLQQAAELGDSTSAHNLGTIFVTGLPGVKSDAQKAKYFYDLAKELGAKFADDQWYM